MLRNNTARTHMARKEDAQPTWWVIDGTDKIVGRLAVQIANVIRGKHRPDFTPHADTGDFVIVVNCGKVRFTGSKWDQITYKHFTGYTGGLKVRTAREMVQRRPDHILREAVRRMLPKNRLARKQLNKLKLYEGPTHEHQAQQPQDFPA